jgi:prepilin-type N-terminal cleavage/methylation domain-containing protein
LNGIIKARNLRRGFSLVELLVVIAIIAVLAALLLPALAHAKDRGRQSMCISNVHQQCLAVMLYADDHDDVLPPTAENDVNGNEVDWPALLDPYIEYVEKIHLCPSDRMSQTNSFGLNELAFVDLTDPNPQPPMHLANFEKPSSSIMLGDIGTADDFKTQRPDTLKLTAPGSTLNDDEDARPATRHFNRCDLTFMDGHGEHLMLNQFYTGQTPTNRWFLP